jgi:hypothetical protein
MFSPNFKLPKPQGRFQRYERDCGVVVFAALAGVSYETVLRDFPDAHLGTITVDAWHRWLMERGFSVTRLPGCPADVFPCAHMVAPVDDRRYAHWVYRDAEGDIHDPSHATKAMPADSSFMKALQMYEYKILTISIAR